MIKSLRIMLIQVKAVLLAVLTVTMFPIGAGFWPREVKNRCLNWTPVSPAGVSLQKLRIASTSIYRQLPILTGVMATMRKRSTVTE